MIEKLKEVIPRQLFTIPLQQSNWRQDNCKRNNICNEKRRFSQMLWWRRNKKKKTTRKAKTWKEKMREIGNVEIPQEAFLSVLKLDDEKNRPKGTSLLGEERIF